MAERLAQGGIRCRPVRDPVLLFVDVTTAVLVELGWHGGNPMSGEGQISYAAPVPGTIERIVHRDPQTHQIYHAAMRDLFLPKQINDGNSRSTQYPDPN